MSFNAICENKILAKIPEFTVTYILKKVHDHFYPIHCKERPLKNRQNKDLNDKW